MRRTSNSITYIDPIGFEEMDAVKGMIYGGDRINMWQTVCCGKLYSLTNDSKHTINFAKFTCKRCGKVATAYRVNSREWAIWALSTTVI